jgi:hypothetical protein
VLTIGATGKDVSALKANLEALGYLDTKGNKMAEFDQPLKEALEVYQAAHYIQGVESGVYCKETQASLTSKVEAAREEAQRKAQEVLSRVLVVCCLLAHLFCCVVVCCVVLCCVVLLYSVLFCCVEWRLHAKRPPAKAKRAQEM